MVSEAIQQGLLIVAVLHPGFAEISEVRFAFLLHVERMFFAQCAHVVAKYPTEWNCRRRIRGLAEWRIVKMAVRGFRPPVVGVVDRSVQFKRRQKRNALAYAAGPFILGKIGKQLSLDLLFGGIVPPFGNAPQLETTAVEARIGANAPVPCRVMPRNAEQGIRH